MFSPRKRKKIAGRLLALPLLLWAFAGGQVCFCAGHCHAAETAGAERGEQHAGDDGPSGCQSGESAPECECAGNLVAGTQPIEAESDHAPPSPAVATERATGRRVAPAARVASRAQGAKVGGPPAFVRFCTFRC